MCRHLTVPWRDKNKKREEELQQRQGEGRFRVVDKAISFDKAISETGNGNGYPSMGSATLYVHIQSIRIRTPSASDAHPGLEVAVNAVGTIFRMACDPQTPTQTPITPGT